MMRRSVVAMFLTALIGFPMTACAGDAGGGEPAPQEQAPAEAGDGGDDGGLY